MKLQILEGKMLLVLFINLKVNPITIKHLQTLPGLTNIEQHWTDSSEVRVFS